MNIKEYQDFVKEGASPSYDDKLAVVGLMGELGELADVIKKKHIYADTRKFEERFGMTMKEKIKDEAGDVLWQYVLVLCKLGLSIEEVMDSNVKKLNNRHKGIKTMRNGGER